MYIHYFLLKRLQSSENVSAEWVQEEKVASSSLSIGISMSIEHISTGNEGWISDHKFKQRAIDKTIQYIHTARKRKEIPLYHWLSCLFIWLYRLYGDIRLKCARIRLRIKLIRFCYRKQFHSLFLESMALAGIFLYSLHPKIMVIVVVVSVLVYFYIEICSRAQTYQCWKLANILNFIYLFFSILFIILIAFHLDKLGITKGQNLRLN